VDWSRLVGWTDPWSPGGRPLAEAWQECPDARWLFASATYAGVPPRTLALALCACVRELLEVDDEGWSRLLDTAEAWGRGDVTDSALAAVLPPLDELADGQPGPERLKRLAQAMKGRMSLAAGAMAADLAAANLIRAMHPEVDANERARSGSDALAFLAALAALESRRSSRATAREMMDEYARGHGGPSLRSMAGRATIERESSPSWDDSASRAFEHALHQCAERVRDVIASPFGAVVEPGSL